MWKKCRFQQTAWFCGLTYTFNINFITYSCRRWHYLSMDTKNAFFGLHMNFWEPKKQDYVLKWKKMWKKCRFQQTARFCGLTFTHSVNVITYSCRRWDYLSMDTKNAFFGLRMDFWEPKKQNYVLKWKKMWKKCRFQKTACFCGLTFTHSVDDITYSCRRWHYLPMDTKNAIIGLHMDFWEPKKQEYVLKWKKMWKGQIAANNVILRSCIYSQYKNYYMCV